MHYMIKKSDLYKFFKKNNTYLSHQGLNLNFRGAFGSAQKGDQQVSANIGRCWGTHVIGTWPPQDLSTTNAACSTTINLIL